MSGLWAKGIVHIKKFWLFKLYELANFSGFMKKKLWEASAWSYKDWLLRTELCFFMYCLKFCV